MTPAETPASEPAIALEHLIYFIRHGETDWNFQRRLQGWSDIPLNDTGRAQARRHARVMAGLGEDWSGFDFAVSPLERCRETFAIIRDELAIAIEPLIDERLREGNFGRWEGWTWEDILAREPENHDLWVTDSWARAPHGGETYGDLARRFADWSRTMTRPTVVISHGGVSRAVRAMYQGLERRDLARLSVPQDRFMRLRDGSVEFL